MKKVWIITISVLATAIIIGGGTYYYLNSKADKEQKELQTKLDNLNQDLSAKTAELQTVTEDATTKTTTATTVDRTGQKKYTYSAIGLSFYYPEAFGTPSIEEKKGKTGSEYVISFSGKEGLFLGATTPDFTTEVGRGGALWEVSNFDYKNGQCSTYKDSAGVFQNYENCEVLTNPTGLGAYFREVNFFEDLYSEGFLKSTKMTPYNVISVSLPKSATSKKVVTDLLASMEVK